GGGASTRTSSSRSARARCTAPIARPIGAASTTRSAIVSGNPTRNTGPTAGASGFDSAPVAHTTRTPRAGTIAGTARIATALTTPATQYTAWRRARAVNGARSAVI